MKVADIKDVCSYYVFSLGDELYAIEAEKVKEIRSGYLKSIYPIANSISSFIGRFYSGAEALPILDLGSLLIINKPSQSQANTILVVDLKEDRYEKKCGLLVDNCMDVVDIEPYDKLTTSLFGPYIKQYFICEKFSERKEMVKILNAETLWEKCCPPLEE